MQRMLTFFLTASCVFVIAACHESNEDAPSSSAPAQLPVSTEAAIDSDRFLANVKELASDAYGGRAPMSQGEKMTLEFLEEAFVEAGFAPLFGDSYRQGVEMISMTVDPATARMSFHGADGEQLLGYGDEMVLWTQRVTPEVRVEDSEMVFVGYGIVAPEYGWNDYAAVDMEGKTAVILVNDPGYATQDSALFNGNAMTYYGRWTYKFEEAARQGADAAIIIHDTAPASYGWNTVRNSWTGAQFYLPATDDGKQPLAVESWIQKSVAESLLESSGQDLAQLQQRALSPEFEAVPLATSLTAGLHNAIIRDTTYNFGAVLRGSEAPDEGFIYTAHWDHLGTGESEDPEEDVIFNGAVDNATGTAALIELAHAFNALPERPRRSVIMLAVTAEESGLLGSRWYAEHPAIPMNKTVGGINIDAMPVYGPTEDVVVVGYGSSELEDHLAEAAAEQGRRVEPEPTPEAGYYYRSDHFNFAKKGVPMLYAESGLEHREFGRAYLEAKDEEYREIRYHQPDDEVEDDWDLRGTMEDIQLYFEVGLSVADSEDWPEWYEGNEFRAIREESLQ